MFCGWTIFCYKHTICATLIAGHSNQPHSKTRNFMHNNFQGETHVLEPSLKNGTVEYASETAWLVCLFLPNAGLLFALVMATAMAKLRAVAALWNRPTKVCLECARTFIPRKAAVIWITK